MLKILQARLQLYVNCELPDVQTGFRKGRGARDQIANIRWVIRKAREFQKNIYFCFIDISNCGKFLKRGEYYTTWPAFWEICMQFRKQQFELDMQQQTASKSGKEYLKPIYYHPCLFNLYAEYIMRNTDWMKHKLESRLPGEISIISDM